MNAALYPYAGCDEQHGNDGNGCGWNDMGLLSAFLFLAAPLLRPRARPSSPPPYPPLPPPPHSLLSPLSVVGGGMTPDQDTSHMALWAIMASKLLISVDPRKFTPHALALVSNPELIAIDQDGAKLQGRRIIPPLNATRAAEDAARIAAWKAANLEGGSWKAAGRSAELLAGGDAGAVPGTEEDEVLAGGGRGEVWQRRLLGGEFALLLFNNGMPAAATIACQGACWAGMGFGAQAVAVRDVIARTSNGTAVGGFSATVPTNGTVLVRLALAP